MPPKLCQTICLLTLAIAWICTPSRGATAEQIDQSIEKGKKFLYSTQQGDGTWEDIVDYGKDKLQEGGVTCMCVYALLTAGDSEKDPRLAKAIQYVVTGPIKGTYSFAFQALALSKLTPSVPVQKALQKVAKHLLEGGERKGLEGQYFYNSATTGDTADNSNSQYGALGMWACGDAGLEIPDKYWEDVQAAWHKNAQKDGGWKYAESDPGGSKISMATAGIATLFIADDALSYKNSGDCKGNVNDTFIDNGMKFMSTRMKNIGDELYTWYGVERIGIASGYKFIGDVDWFKVGAQQIVQNQAANGSWKAEGSFQVGTSYAVLFLVRGKAPIIMNKLRYEKVPTDPNSIDGPWNERNRDAANAAKFIGDQLENFMNWQVVTLAVNPDEFHDSPILYLAGNEPLVFTPAQEAKLRQFIEDGGMLLGNADCATASFSDSFKNLCKRLVDGQYEFRPLPVDHPIYTHQQFPQKKWGSKPLVDGMSNGVRELAILIPAADPSRAWQTRQFKNKRDLFELITDIYLYSVDRQNIAEKGVTYIIRPGAAIAADKTIKIARVQYTGNWNPEPGGWRRLAAFMHNEHKIDLAITPVTLGAGELGKFTLAHLTGTSALTLDAPARDEIKKFIDAGGTLIIDSAGGSKDFSDSVQKEMSAIFGAAADQLQSPLPAESPVFGGMPGGEFRFRSYTRVVDKTISPGPSLRAMLINNRPAVIFSPQDISAGLVGENVDGINGYIPETCIKLMSALVQPAPAAPPTTRP